MGAFLSAFGTEVDVSDCKIDINAEPVEAERELIEKVTKTLEQCKVALEMLQEYEDCSQLVKRAMGDPTPDHEAEAWTRAQLCAGKAKKFYETSQALELIFPELLKSLASDDQKSTFLEKQAVCSKTASLLEFALTFDGLRVMRPTLPNDMAYYRRSLSKHANEGEIPVRDDEASYVMLFIAQMSPMTAAMAKGTSNLMKSSAFYGTQVPKVLALMANICLALVRSKEIDEATIQKSLYAMVGAMIVYDHVSPEGVFNARGLNTKSAVTLVVKDYPQQPHLANALKYCTVHYSDDATPASIKAILESA